MSELLVTCSQEPNESMGRSDFCEGRNLGKGPEDGGCSGLSCSKCMFHISNEEAFAAWNVTFKYKVPEDTEPNPENDIDDFCGSLNCVGIRCQECMFDNEEAFDKWNVVGAIKVDTAEETYTAEEIPGGSCPSQYALPEGASELQDLIEHREMNFSIGNVFKACYRMNDCAHSDAKRNLNKILWFAQRELDRINGIPKEG